MILTGMQVAERKMAILIGTRNADKHFIQESGIAQIIVQANQHI